MKVLYIHQYFHTPSESAATRSYWISQELINRGHNVVLITSTDERVHNAGVEMVDGIEVHYVINPYSNYMSPFKKVRAFLRFIHLAIKEVQSINNVDLVYATSTPLTVGYIAMKIKSRYKIPYVFEVRDLWPEFPIQIGAIKNKLVIRYLKSLEKRIYMNSEFVVALSPGMLDGVLSTGFPVDKTAMIPNMSKPDFFYPHTPDSKIAARFGINLSDFNVIHFGSMGRANGLKYIIDAAKICAKRGANDICFFFMGSGATEPLLKRMVEEDKLSNVRFLGKHNMFTVSEVVNCCDATITSFINLPILRTNSPNKLFDSLSAGKPIIVNSAGWTKQMVEEEDCGFFVDPDKPEDLASMLIKYKDDAEQLRIWGDNARRLSTDKYDKSILTAQVADVLESVYKKVSLS